MDEYIAKAKNNGAAIVRGKMEFDEFYLAYLVDPCRSGVWFNSKKINRGQIAA